MKELDLAIKTAKKAGTFLVASLARTKTKTSKGKSDWVTNIDVEVENLIRIDLQNNFPEYGFSGEESSRVKGKSKLEWIVDPIDSTDNFIHQLPHFTTTIALMQGEKPILGVIYEPLAANLFYACKDKGAFLNNKRIHVSPIKNVSEALFFSVPGNREGDDMEEGVRIYNALLQLRTSMKSWGSVALEVAYIAAGQAEAAAYVFNDPYSLPAAKIILEEAGGTMTTLQGDSWNQKSASVLASNEILHKTLLKHLQKF